MKLLLENNIRGDISSFIGDIFVKSDENKKCIWMPPICMAEQWVNLTMKLNLIKMLN